MPSITMFKTLKFFTQEYDGPIHRIIILALLGGVSFALFLAVVSHAAQVFPHASLMTQIQLFLVYGVAVAVSLLSKHRIQKHTLIIAENVVRKKRVKLIDKLRHTELQFLEQSDTGEIYARIVNDTQLISQVTPHIATTIEALFACIVVLLYIASLSVNGFIIVLFSVLAFYFIFFFSHFKIRENIQADREKESEFISALKDALSGFKEIKINAQKSHALYTDIQKLAQDSERIKTAADIAYDKNLIEYLVMFYLAIACVLFLLPVYSDIHSHNFIKIVTAMLFILGLLGLVSRGIYYFMKLNVVVEKIQKLEVRIDALGSQVSSVASISADFQKITLEAISYQYTDKEGDMLFPLGPVDLEINQGETVFIVGGNGSGKSTLLKLITGLYYPMANGFIALNDNRITTSNYQSYRELFSIIFTDFHLFKQLYGLETVDDQQVRLLLKKMGLHMKTDCVQGKFTNTDLSTGQRKRLAYIAAILEDRPIYVFDEWAADQDPTYRRYFYEKFLGDLKAMNKTVIAVTHDDRYFDRADKVIKMEEGQIIEVQQA